MSHDEIENTHVNTQDLSPIDAIGYALGVALPATVEMITARVARLLSSERGYQRASEQLLQLQLDLSAVRAQNATGRQQLAAAESELASLREAHGWACAERDQKSGTLAATQAQLREALVRGDALAAEVSRQMRMLSDTSGELRLAHEATAQAREERDMLQRQLEEIRALFPDASRRIDSIAGMVRALFGERVDLVSQRDRLQRALTVEAAVVDRLIAALRGPS